MLKRALVLLLAVAWVPWLWAGVPKSTEWPQWRGPAYSGATRDDAFEPGGGLGFRVTWKKALGSGYSSISVAQGRAVTMYSDGDSDHVIAFEAGSGKELWRHKIDETYYGHSGSHDGTLSTPAIDDGVVYVVGPRGQVLALDASSGRTVWETSMGALGSAEPRYGWTTSPLVYENVLILETGAGEGQAVSGLNKKTGELLWRAGNVEVTYQSPVLLTIHGVTQAVCLGNQAIFGLDPLTGQMQWELRHEGGGEDASPVPAGSNRIYVDFSGEGGLLIQVDKGSNGFVAKELWRNTELKNSNSPTVYHEGYLFGFSGPYLTCVDAATGRRVWRSRAPGDGFLMLVNGFLVTLTKSGSLHAAKASSQGYDDVVVAQVFDYLGWNPPSFAGGKVFARNLKEIACLELAPVEGALKAEASVVHGIVPGTEIAAFVDQVERASNKKKLVDDFMKAHSRFPIIEGDRFVHVLYRGDAEDIAIAGDLVESNVSHPLNRVKGTDLYYYSFELEPDAVIGYSLIKDFEDAMADPLNPTKVSSFGNEQSELVMPRCRDAGYLDEPTGDTGKVESFELASEQTKNTRQIQVYLPPGYEGSDSRYPVVYVNYGGQAVDEGLWIRSLDNLVGRTVSPLIAVFIHLQPEDGFQELSDTKDQYAAMVADELVPMIDARYRTVTKAEARAVVGASSAGYISVLIALKSPEVFGWAGGQSSNLFAPRADEIRDLVAASEHTDTAFFLHWGRYDTRNEQAEIDFRSLNRTMAEQLRAKGYTVYGGEMNHGYGWGSWRRVTRTMLETMFPLRPDQPG